VEPFAIFFGFAVEVFDKNDAQAPEIIEFFKIVRRLNENSDFIMNKLESIIFVH